MLGNRIRRRSRIASSASRPTAAGVHGTWFAELIEITNTERSGLPGGGPPVGGSGGGAVLWIGPGVRERDGEGEGWEDRMGVGDGGVGETAGVVGGAVVGPPVGTTGVVGGGTIVGGVVGGRVVGGGVVGGGVVAGGVVGGG